MFAESIITIIFRILNFAALIGLFAFMFKKYFRKEIETSIENDRLAEINLHTRIIEIEHRGSELSEEIIKQEKLCQHLVARTDQWKVAFEKDIKLRQLEQQALRKLMAERAERQAKSIAYERVIQAVLPTALERARTRLAKSFANPADGKEFVQTILNHMKKSI